MTFCSLRSAMPPCADMRAAADRAVRRGDWGRAADLYDDCVAEHGGGCAACALGAARFRAKEAAAGKEVRRVC